MRAMYLAAAILGWWTSAAAAEPALVATPLGIGGVKVGMTTQAAEKALGQKLKLDFSIAGEACAPAWTTKSRLQGYYLMVQDKRVTRIDIGLPKKASGHAPILTPEGVGVGSSEAAVRKAYGKRLLIEPHPYLYDQGHYLIVEDSDHKHGIIFETDTKRVTSYRTGLFSAVSYIEGCA
ncbi:hypothetical protein FHS83_003682 [Rhizomicrobium palustre]|uniref:Uncharacterized protein n=1 Tax=Rhizomicrobium palustre TaxID=189966 RepID=A0A846N2X4_9PROT|nr:hypothetical protein [Rhizomicrobium palustre]NIK90364.1 hypothetical protein [Rhizomicrobium palustre]